MSKILDNGNGLITAHSGYIEGKISIKIHENNQTKEMKPNIEEYVAQGNIPEILKLHLMDNEIDRSNIDIERDIENRITLNRDTGLVIPLDSEISYHKVLWNNILDYTSDTTGNPILGSVITQFINHCINIVGPHSMNENECKIWIKDILKSYNIFIDTTKTGNKIYYIRHQNHSSKTVCTSFPMVITPYNWTLSEDQYYGGRLLNEEMNISPIIRNIRSSKLKKVKISNVTINILNKIQSIPFNINADMINKLIQSYENQIKQLREQLDNVKKQERRIILSRMNPMIYKKRWVETYLEFIKLYNIETIWFPIKIDFRGRYYLETHLSYTSLPLLRNCLTPYIKDEYDNKEENLTLDATASALQMLAIMTGNREMLKLCNVISNKEPQDPYKIFITVSEPITNEEENYIMSCYELYKEYNPVKKRKKKKGKKEYPWDGKISTEHLCRDVIKTTVMTWIYGSSPSTIARKLQEQG